MTKKKIEVKSEYYKVEGVPHPEYDIVYFEDWDIAMEAINDYFADVQIGEECMVKFTTVMLTEDDYDQICNGER